MLFFTLDLGRNGIDEKKPEAGKYAYHMLFFFFKSELKYVYKLYAF